MRVYLAGAYKRRAELKEIAADLRASGIEITSTWLDAEDTDLSPENQKIMACRDVIDIHNANIIVRFSDTPELLRDKLAWEPGADPRLVSGARHFEMGFVYGMNWLTPGRRKLFVVGGPQNVFDYLDEVTHVADVEELKEKLTSWQIN